MDTAVLADIQVPFQMNTKIDPTLKRTAAKRENIFSPHISQTVLESKKRGMTYF